MAQSIKYRSLFSVDVLHHYFLDKGSKHYEALNAEEKIKQLAFYDVNDFFEIIPTPACRKLLQDHKLIFRNTNKGMLVGSKIDPIVDRPYVNILENIKFTFYIKLKNKNFFNFTALPLNFNALRCFYFSNRGKISDASKIQFLNLSDTPETYTNGATYKSGRILRNPDDSATLIITRNTNNATENDGLKDSPALAFDNAEEYKKGDIVLITNNGTDQLYEAKEDQPEDTPEDTAGNDWRKLIDLPLNYTNQNDLIEIVKPLFNYQLASPNVTATAVLSSVSTNGLIPVKIDAISETTSYQFDWRKIPSGLYELQVNDDDLADADPNKIISDQIFYLNNGTIRGGVFGIIDIYASRSNDNDYALLNTNGQFQDNKNQFIIRFKNRSTIWRYIFREGQSVSIEDDVLVENSDDKILVTNEIKPLTKNGLIPISKGNGQLPNPTTKHIKPESNNIFSEIYL